MKLLDISVAIPTYGREEVLLDIVDQVLRQNPAAAEVLVLDQTPEHEPKTAQVLTELAQRGAIRWLRIRRPSQPAALNRALMESSQPITLFLDDDIRIVPGFIQAHAVNYENPEIWAVAGQVIQPDQSVIHGFLHQPSSKRLADLDFPFNSDQKCFVTNAISCNFSVRTKEAIDSGCFDENFTPPVGYRFDAEFCKRICRRGGKIVFEPAARIYHLRYSRGGTRIHGGHLTSISPSHGVGDYYFAIRQGVCTETLGYTARRPIREICTKFHLKHPWWIPVKLIGEFRAIFQAIQLAHQGPRFPEPGRFDDDK
jgi:glycosyltransferase involved in cell wall biosynthesis